MAGPRRRKRLIFELMWHREFRCHFCLRAVGQGKHLLGEMGRRFFVYPVNLVELFLYPLEKMILKSVSVL